MRDRRPEYAEPVIPVPLDAEQLRRELVQRGPYAALDVVTVTGSTNSDLASAASGGAADRTVLLTEEQTAGRGRLNRRWYSPRYRALQLSVLLRPELPQRGLGWLPLLTGVALAETVNRASPRRAALKWPNDLLLRTGSGWGKAAGILAEVVAAPDGLAVVVGMGINVHHRQEELPPPVPDALPATSLALAGVEVDRTEFAVRLLTAFAETEQLWRRHAGDVQASGLLDRYRGLCATLHQRVRVDLAAEQLHGTAVDVDPDGRLVVRTEDGRTTEVAAGDVQHLRPAGR